MRGKWWDGRAHCSLEVTEDVQFERVQNVVLTAETVLHFQAFSSHMVIGGAGVGA